MTLNTQQERQNWFWNKEEVEIVVNSLKRAVDRSKKTIKHRGNVIIQLNKEIARLKEIIKKYEDDNT